MLMQSSWKNTCKKQLKTQNKFFCFPQKFAKNQLTIWPFNGLNTAWNNAGGACVLNREKYHEHDE
jgi:hypothetical protein